MFSFSFVNILIRNFSAMSIMRIIFLCICLLSFWITSVSLTNCGEGCKLCGDEENECQECKQGFYKSRNICNLCSNGCLSCQTDDICDICKDAFGLINGTCQPCLKGCRQCTFEEHIKCVSCIKGYYTDGNICKSCNKDPIACSPSDKFDICIGATFWNGLTCSSCPIVCTRCSSNKCSECKSGFYGPTCQDLCSEGCISGTCAQSTGSCSCKDGFIGLKCDIQCPEKCKDCYSDFNCSDCKHGYYGERCQNTCPFGCLDHICDKNNGICINKVCKANFVGNSCDKCEQGKYGEHCQSSCPVHCASCNSDQYCTDCNDGFYGKGCNQKCPSNCFQGMCTKEGLCYSCIEGYYGHTCEERCPDQCQTCVNNDGCRSCHVGFYGNVCQSNCSFCLNLTCRQDDGACIHDCRNGSDGLKCEPGDKGASITITGLAVTGALIIITISGCVIFAVNKRRQRSTSASDETVVNSAVEMNQRQYEELLPSQGPVYINLQNDSTDNQTTHIYEELTNNMI